MKLKKSVAAAGISFLIYLVGASIKAAISNRLTMGFFFKDILITALLVAVIYLISYTIAVKLLDL